MPIAVPYRRAPLNADWTNWPEEEQFCLMCFENPNPPDVESDGDQRGDQQAFFKTMAVAAEKAELLTSNGRFKVIRLWRQDGEFFEEWRS